MQSLAIVTGASRGIGRAIALELAQSHQVLATYRGNHEAAESLATAAPGRIHVLQSDISSAADRAALLAHAALLGPIDLLVNNAGIAPRERRDILDATEDSFDELLSTNLKGPHFLTQAVARQMLARSGQGKIAGRIIFITSISSFTASVNRAEYCIAKAGLSMSAQTFATRLAPHGVLVFEIQPGIIATDMIAKVKEVYEERISAGLLPQRRMGQPEDIAKLTRAIASGMLDYSAGQVLHADGGFHLRSL